MKPIINNGNFQRIFPEMPKNGFWVNLVNQKLLATLAHDDSDVSTSLFIEKFTVLWDFRCKSKCILLA